MAPRRCLVCSVAQVVDVVKDVELAHTRLCTGVLVCSVAQVVDDVKDVELAHTAVMYRGTTKITCNAG